MNTAYYIECFDKLVCAVHKGRTAPHKPILLLSLIRLAEQGKILSETVYLGSDLEAAFQQVWLENVHDNLFKMQIGMPFYHMRSEPFWDLQIDSSYGIDISDKNKLKNASTLKKVSARAVIDGGLLQCLQDEAAREKLRLFLLSRYFHRNNSNSDHSNLPLADLCRFTQVPNAGNEDDFCPKLAA